jgi:hypothetical protein
MAGEISSHAAPELRLGLIDGSEGEALRSYGDEARVCEGDVPGKTQEELRSLHCRRDRDSLQS